jgi:outer membrane protein
MSTAPAQISHAAPARFLKKALGVAVMTLLSSSVLAEDLLQIFNLAVENDPVIRQARANYNAQHTQIDQGRALLLPSVTLQAQTGRSTSGPTEASPPSANNPFGTPAHSYGAGYNSKGYNLNLTQAVFNMEAWYSFQSLRKTDQIALLTLQEAEQQLIMRVSTAYFDVLRAQADLASFQAAEAAATQLLEQTQQRFDVGLIPITDVYNTQASTDNATVSRLLAENTLNQRFEALEAITGVDYSAVSTLSPEFPIAVPESSLDEWTTMTSEGNLPLQRAELDFDAKKDDARAARSRMLPTVQLGMGYNWSQSGSAFSFFRPNSANEGTQIQLSFSVPLFAGGRNRAAMRQAYYTRDASEAVLLRTQRESTQTISNNYRSVETDVRAVAARAQAIVSAESSLEASTVGAEVGTRNIVDVVNAQSTLFQAQRDHANARIQYVMDTLILKQTAGVLTPQDVMDLNQWLVE